MSDEEELRKWCLEKAFERRDQQTCWHKGVCSEAKEYYDWITLGSALFTTNGPSKEQPQ